MSDEQQVSIEEQQQTPETTEPKASEQTQDVVVSETAAQEAPVETQPLVTQEPAAAVVAPQATVVVAKKEPIVTKASGTINASTTSPVGTTSSEGQVASSLATKLSDSVKLDLGILKFTPEGQALIERVLDTGTELTKRTIRDVLQYTKDMAPGVPVNIDGGSLKQINLYRTLMNSINNAPTDFQLMFATILRIVYETKDTGAFQVKYVFRFFPSMPLNKADRDNFSALIHAMLQLCNPSGRAVALKQIDFNKLVAFGYTPQGRQRMLSFFNI